MKNLKFLVLEGDGIGPEITKASTDVLKAALDKFNMSVELIYEEIGYGTDNKLFYGKSNINNSNSILPSGSYFYVFSLYK